MVYSELFLLDRYPTHETVTVVLHRHRETGYVSLWSRTNGKTKCNVRVKSEEMLAFFLNP